MKPATRIPPLRALRAFQAAGRHLSFKKAAEELCVTASAVSHQVKNLESFLGLSLFIRKTRALELTGAGQKYLEFLSEMFARLEAETHQLRAEYGRSIIRLCVPPFFANELFHQQPEIRDFDLSREVSRIGQGGLTVHEGDCLHAVGQRCLAGEREQDEERRVDA